MTKAQRLLKIVDIFRAKHGGRPVTMDEVATWAISRGLYPVPTLRAHPSEVQRWDELLEDAKLAGVTTSQGWTPDNRG